MKNIKILLSIFFLLISIISFAQTDLRITPYIEGEIILKTNDTLKGYVSLNNSEWDVRFTITEKQKKAQKIKYKTIEKIIIDVNSSNPREFYYMKSDRTKFLSFVEKVYSNEISIYTKSSDEVSSFYADFDRRTTEEWVNDMRYESLKMFPENYESTIEINNQQTIVLRNYNFYGSLNMNFRVDIEIPSTDYYLLKKGEQKIIYIGTEGNFIRRGFKKFAIDYFNDCPILVEKFEQKELKIQHLPEIIELYNNNCSYE